MKIDFAIAGFQKCGTTSLHYYLEQQEDVFMPKEKEMYYYTNLSDSKKREEYRASFFEEYKGEKLIGFSDVDLIMSKEALSRFKQANPSAKLIIMIREPIKRATSAYNYEYSKCLEKNKNLNDAIEIDLSSNEFGYISRSRYFENIQHALDVFSENELLILKMEDLQSKKAETLKKVSTFLDCSVSILNDEKYNETGSPKSLIMQRLLWDQSNFIHKFFSIFPRSVKKFIKLQIKQKLIKINLSKQPKQPNQTLNINLYNQYLKADNEKMIAVLGCGYEDES